MGMDSRKGWYDGVEEIKTNLLVVTEFVGTRRTGRKSSPNLCRKFAGTQAVHDELRREMEGATSGGSRWGFRMLNQHVEENTGIYIVVGFGNFLEFLNFGIILIP
jgi:hypothetical protein